jgi:dTDP-4-dehydrorhamnose 3,5-epimerase
MEYRSAGIAARAPAQRPECGAHWPPPRHSGRNAINPGSGALRPRIESPSACYSKPKPMSSLVQGELPRDVKLVSLQPHRDSRGVFTELFREEWFPNIHVVQWNLVHTGGGVLRGVHVHRRHLDYLTVTFGGLQVGLCDLRAGGPTFRTAAMVRLEPGHAIVVPPGVAHGFYSAEASGHIYAVTEYWDTADELGCQWSDPALGIPWDVRAPLLSPRDAALPPLERLLETLA